MTYSQVQNGSYVLILEEVGGVRRLPIIIGAFEAHAIAIEMEKIKPSRPLTHDLFVSFANAFGIQLREVIINKFQAGVFYALLVCDDSTHQVNIDSRTSDAIALALRFNCNIYTYESIMAEASITIDDDESDEAQDEGKEVKTESELSNHTIAELRELLEKAIAEEDYERAGKIRDEIKLRK